jgi:putative ABC transport system permease protein
MIMPGPLLQALRGGLTRRPVQTIGISLVLLVSTAASVLGLALVVDSNGPFDHAFAAQRGADVVATIDSSKATQAELAVTRRLPEVIAAAGPFAQVTLRSVVAGPGGQPLRPMVLAGRASPGGRVDDVTLQSGRWADRPGEVVLNSDELYPSGDVPSSVVPGAQIWMISLPQKPTLTVVGIATSVSDSADGWVTPGEIAALRTSRTPSRERVLYRFRRAGTASAIGSDIAAVAAALPAGAVTATESYLTIKAQEASGIAPIAPFLVAFGVIGLVMSALIVVNIVSGAVVSGYRRIGILKSIGFTPGQVVAAYTGQALAPAVAGCLVGILAGNLLAEQLLGRTAKVYGVQALAVPTWVDAGVPAGMCLLVGIAALLPAARAGRLSAVQAIATGRAPREGHGYAAHRLLGRLPLPRPVTIGLAAPFARPTRTAVTLAAIMLGTVAVTFAVGLSTTLSRVVYGLSLAKTEPIQVALPPASPTAAAEEAITKALRAQPGTLHYVAEADQQVKVVGLAQQIPVTAFRGDAGWIGYDMIKGRWYSGADQVDVPAGFLSATGEAVGDKVTITFDRTRIAVRIVGEVFDTNNSGVAMFTDWQTLARSDRGLTPNTYDVGLSPGISAGAYSEQLGARLGQAYSVGVKGLRQVGLLILLGLISILTVLLAIVAGLGVLNTVMLQIRERAHDLGVFKAVGMTPGQTIAMVVCWVAGIGLVAGVIAVPAGVALHRYLVPVMAAAAGTGLPSSFVNVYHSWELVALVLAGVVIAVAGALLPAGWIARTRTASVLRAE